MNRKKCWTFLYLKEKKKEKRGVLLRMNFSAFTPTKRDEDKKKDEGKKEDKRLPNDTLFRKLRRSYDEGDCLFEYAWRHSLLETKKRLFPFPALDDKLCDSPEAERNKTFTFKLMVCVPVLAKEEVENLRWTDKVKMYFARLKAFGASHAALQIGSRVVHYLGHGLVEIGEWRAHRDYVLVAALDEEFAQLPNTVENRTKIAEVVCKFNTEDKMYEQGLHDCQTFVQTVFNLLGGKISNNSMLSKYMSYIRNFDVSKGQTPERLLYGKNGSILRRFTSHGELDEWMTSKRLAELDEEQIDLLKAYCRGFQLRAVKLDCPFGDITFTCCRRDDDPNQVAAMARYIANHQKQYRVSFKQVVLRDGPRANGVRILCLDGGGMRGVAIVQRLLEMEQLTKIPIYKMFDLIVGTSTGAILALALSHMRMPAEEIMGLYRLLGGQLFGENVCKKVVRLITEGSLCQSIQDAVQGVLNDQPMLAQELPKVATVSCEAGNSKPWVFTNYERAAPDFSGTTVSGLKPMQWSSQATLFQAASASAALPGILPEFKFADTTFIDGGLVANNPTLVGIHEAKSLFPNFPISLVVSMGTGHFEKTSNSGRLLDVASQFLARATQGEQTAEQARNYFKDTPGVYYRFQTKLDIAMSLDEVRPEKIDELVGLVSSELKKEQNGAWMDLISKLLSEE